MNLVDHCICFLNFYSFVVVSLCFICLFECWCCTASSPVCAIASLHVWLKNSMTCNFRIFSLWINHTLLLLAGCLFSFLRVHESWDMREMCRPCLAVAHLDWHLKTLPKGKTVTYEKVMLCLQTQWDLIPSHLPFSLFFNIREDFLHMPICRIVLALPFGKMLSFVMNQVQIQLE